MTAVMSGQASKFIVAVIAAVAAALPQYFGTAPWEPIVVYALGALGVYLVPNAPPPAVPPPAVPPQVPPPA